MEIFYDILLYFLKGHESMVCYIPDSVKKYIILKYIFTLYKINMYLFKYIYFM